MNDQLYIEKQLANRKDDSIGNLFKSAQILDKRTIASLIMTANTDIGVARNGGKKGSKYAAHSITSSLKKMAKSFYEHQIILTDVNNIRDEQLNTFDSMQDLESQKILNSISQNEYTNTFHIGGGHDHIYPLIKAYSQKFSKIKVLNLDAHLDTRIDTSFHSGTPFRQAFELNNLDLKLFQFGIKELSNARSNYDLLKMNITTMNQINSSSFSLEKYLTTFLEDTSEDELIILSLDTDAIISSDMEAVSAVNPTGLDFQIVKECYKTIQNYCTQSKRPFVTGIYEYNPIFDNLSNKGSRLIAELIYETIFNIKA